MHVIILSLLSCSGKKVWRQRLKLLAQMRWLAKLYPWYSSSLKTKQMGRWVFIKWQHDSKFICHLRCSKHVLFTLIYYSRNKDLEKEKGWDETLRPDRTLSISYRLDMLIYDKWLNLSSQPWDNIYPGLADIKCIIEVNKGHSCLSYQQSPSTL